MIAPDGWRAGLVWEIADVAYFQTLSPADSGRWGVFGVGNEIGPTSTSAAHRFLEELVPRLRVEWEEASRLRE